MSNPRLTVFHCQQAERGTVAKPARDSAKADDYALVRRTVNILLARDEQRPLQATYDRIYRACRAAMDEAGKGEGLYDAVKIALEKCVKELVEELNSDARKSVEWLVPFTNVCVWYEKQVVSPFSALLSPTFMRDGVGSAPVSIGLPRHPLCRG